MFQCFIINVFKLHKSLHIISQHGGSELCKELLLLKEHLFSVNKGGMNCKHKLETGYSFKPQEDTIGTLWEFIYTLQVVSFLVLVSF